MEYRKKCYVNENWKTAFRKDPEELPPEQEDEWVTADLPHNWEDYQGYRGLSHGNLHGTAWYRKRLRLPKETGRWFLELEGAGSGAEGRYIPRILRRQPDRERKMKSWFAQTIRKRSTICPGYAEAAGERRIRKVLSLLEFSARFLFTGQAVCASSLLESASCVPGTTERFFWKFAAS